VSNVSASWYGGINFGVRCFIIRTSPNIIRAIVRNEIEVHVACMEEILVARPVGPRPFGRPRCKWEVSIKFD
jgi:hypothetical protein